MWAASDWAGRVITARPEGLVDEAIQCIVIDSALEPAMGIPGLGYGIESRGFWPRTLRTKLQQDFMNIGRLKIEATDFCASRVKRAQGGGVVLCRGYNSGVRGDILCYKSDREMMQPAASKKALDRLNVPL